MAANIDGWELQIRDLLAMHTPQGQILIWLRQQGVTVSLRTLERRIQAWQASNGSTVRSNDIRFEQLIEAVNDLFHHNPTYSDARIAQRLRNDGLHTSPRQVKAIRLKHGWYRRVNDVAAALGIRAETSIFIQQLLADGQIRQYGHRQLITHLSRAYGHRAQDRHVRYALQALDIYGVPGPWPLI
jgi:hypothetical protein